MLIKLMNVEKTEKHGERIVLKLKHHQLEITAVQSWCIHKLTHAHMYFLINLVLSYLIHLITAF